VGQDRNRSMPPPSKGVIYVVKPASKGKPGGNQVTKLFKMTGEKAQKERVGWLGGADWLEAKGVDQVIRKSN